MEIFELAYLCFSLVCVLALAFVVFHFSAYALNRVNVFRASQDKKPFSSKLVFLLSLASAFAFLV